MYILLVIRGMLLFQWSIWLQVIDGHFICLLSFFEIPWKLLEYLLPILVGLTYPQIFMCNSTTSLCAITSSICDYSMHLYANTVSKSSPWIFPSRLSTSLSNVKNGLKYWSMGFTTMLPMLVAHDCSVSFSFLTVLHDLPRNRGTALRLCMNKMRFIQSGDVIGEGVISKSSDYWTIKHLQSSFKLMGNKILVNKFQRENPG